MKLVHLRSELIMALAVFFLGLVVSGGFAYALYRVDAREYELNAEKRAKRSAENVANALDAFGDKVVALAAFLNAAPNVNREQFAQVVRRTMARYETALVAANRTPALGFALEYVPKVLQQQRPTFEQAVRAEGIKDFVIFDRVSGSKAPASNRPFYYPVHYIEPYAGNEGAVGFDLYSEPQRRQAIDRALSEGKMQSTGRISLVQESGAQYGLLLFAPVGIAPDGLKATEGSGFALGVLRVSQLVSTAAVAIEDKIVLLDRSAPEGEQLLHPRLADESAAIASLGTQAARHPLKIGGRDLDIFVSIPSFEPASGKYLSVLVLGLLGFGGMSMFVYRSSRVTARAMHSSRELQKALEEIEQSREALQASQDLLRREIYDLSAPILHLGKRVIALPIVGQLSEERMGQIMSVLLDAVSQHQTSTAIIDLAGVKGASSIAPHWILKTSDAASLMGVRTIVTSLSPEMVRTFIESGVDTARLNFKSSLGEAIAKHEN